MAIWCKTKEDIVRIQKAKTRLKNKFLDNARMMAVDIEREIREFDASHDDKKYGNGFRPLGEFRAYEGRKTEFESKLREMCGGITGSLDSSDVRVKGRNRNYKE